MIRIFGSFVLSFLSLGGQMHRRQHILSILMPCSLCHRQFASTSLPEENFPFFQGLFTAVSSWNTQLWVDLWSTRICTPKLHNTFILSMGTCSCYMLRMLFMFLTMLKMKDFLQGLIFFPSEHNSILLCPFIRREIPCFHLLQCSTCIS